MNTINFDKLKNVFRSRKFWAAFISTITSVSALILGEIDVWQFLQAIIAIMAAYSTGVAIEDAGIGAGGNIPQ